MAAVLIVEFSEVMQLFPQVSGAPERYMIEILSPDCADQSFYKRVRERYMRHSLDFADLEYSKIGLPLMETEQRIIVTAEEFWQIGPTDRLAKHPTEYWTIDSSCVYAKANDLARELVHDDENPVALEYERFTAKQIDTPQTIF